MTSSVVICTYNGASYLEQQLDSILSQTVLPNAIIICDDGSTDRTLDIINNYISHRSLDIKLEVNVTRLGPIKNFAII